MATIYPDWKTIHKGHQPPTEGEITFLKYLENNLDDEYEIYFQPYLNGDRPDIAVMRKGGGVLLIEVKDYNLDLYRVNENKKWEVQKAKSQWQRIGSPFQQVYDYKENLFELHSKDLLVGRMKKKELFRVVNCAVFFSKSTYQEVEQIVKVPFRNNPKYESYLRFISYFEIYTKDTLTIEKLKKHLEKTWISRKSKLFEEKYYISIKRYLKPPNHYEEEGIDITYTKAQKVLLQSIAGKRQKIKGVAGCGKTFVLAKRAVNAYLRTGEQVLILTYNLSLVNYIRDRISDVKAKFPWSAFHIINYHQFFKSEVRNYELKIKDLDDWNNPIFFEPVKNNIKKYSSVFIDEVQDYQTEWLDLINTYFVRSDGEFVVFGDEKQNIYSRPLDEEKNIVTKGIRGDWNRSLKSSLRFTENIAKLAARFQQQFLGIKYNLEQMSIISQSELGFSNSLGTSSKIDYYSLEGGASAKDYFDIINTYIRQHKIHSSDVAILGATIDIIREIDYLVRHETEEKTITTFEKKEFFDEHKPTREELKKLRRVKKLYFFMKTGTMKLSTIHSFKGWDIPTLFLVINDLKVDSGGFTTHELVYTAITRARHNLIILNAASKEYDMFFRNEQ